MEVVEKPVLTPPIASTTKPLTHIVQKGDCLWNIAHNAFGDPFKWTLIYEANKSKINNPDLIYPNQEFDIPKNNK
jgi:nucleoid-associated protein YgaU